MEATAEELKNGLRWRRMPVGGLKVDLVQRLAGCSYPPWPRAEGFVAAAWAAQVARQRLPLCAFRSETDLADPVGRVLSTSRR